ncbi:MAG: hypothetical protein KF688_04560 [Pirellulales bacterium]|nr:hypothetical protein [Pirellulales bacterium]MBX3434368.1 hypothetical protein [Pirellulales bacterium]
MCSADCAIEAVLSAQASAVHQQIGYALAAKSLEAAKAQGAAVSQMLASAAQIGKAVDKGAQLDAIA